MSETISPRLPLETLKKLGELADGEGGDHPSLICELLEHESRRKMPSVQLNCIGGA